MSLPVRSSYPGSIIVCPSCRSPDGSCALATVTLVSSVPITIRRINPSFDCVVASDLRNNFPMVFSQSGCMHTTISSVAREDRFPRQRHPDGGTRAGPLQPSARVRQANFIGERFLFRLLHAGNHGAAGNRVVRLVARTTKLGACRA